MKATKHIFVPSLTNPFLSMAARRCVNVILERAYSRNEITKEIGYDILPAIEADMISFWEYTKFTIPNPQSVYIRGGRSNNVATTSSKLDLIACKLMLVITKFNNGKISSESPDSDNWKQAREELAQEFNFDDLNTITVHSLM